MPKLWKARSRTHRSLRRVRLFPLLFVAAVIGFAPGTVRADEPLAGPARPASGGESRFNPVLWFLSFYGEHISAVDGDRCPSYPTCSTYAKEAFEKHGFFMGWMMTVDRLIHEGSEETRVSPYIEMEGELRIFDPLQNNDFWWYPGEGKHGQ